jgi:hypothetical protein
MDSRKPSISRSRLVAAVVPGIERQPLKRLDADEAALLKLLHRWRNEAGLAGRQIKRIVIAYEAGRDGFWLARSAAGARCRGLRHPCRKCRGAAQTSARED